MNNKRHFKEALRLIEIEIFSYCNRKCWFCPNSFIDRMSTNKEMPEQEYLSLLEQLQEIDFSGELTYSRYNEPLSHKDLFLKRVRQAREMLPNAILRTNSNGDYVQENILKSCAILDLTNCGYNNILEITKNMTTKECAAAQRKE